MRRNHVPWRAAGTTTEQKRSADEVVQETGWVFNNVTGSDLSLAEFVETGDHETLAYLTAFGLGDEPHESQTLVEIGSGIGRMTASFTRMFGRVVACDLDAAFLERCRETVAQFGRPERLQTSPVADGRTHRVGRRLDRRRVQLHHVAALPSRGCAGVDERGRADRARRRTRGAELPHVDGARRRAVAGRQGGAGAVACAQARPGDLEAPIDRPARLAGQPAVADRGHGGGRARGQRRADRALAEAPSFAIPGTSDFSFEGVHPSHWWLVAVVIMSDQQPETAALAFGP